MVWNDNRMSEKEDTRTEQLSLIAITISLCLYYKEKRMVVELYDQIDNLFLLIHTKLEKENAQEIKLQLEAMNTKISTPAGGNKEYRGIEQSKIFDELRDLLFLFTGLKEVSEITFGIVGDPNELVTRGRL